MAESPALARTRRFYEWEVRGRGWLVHSDRVALEPPFRAFTGHDPPVFIPIDDGRRETVLSRLFSRPKEAPSPELPEVEPSPEPAGAFDFEERRLLLPEKLPPAFANTYLSILGLADPLAIEWVGHQGRVEYRLAATSADLALLEGGLRGVAPEIRPREARPLADLWRETGAYVLLLEFGLAYEFMAPLTAAAASQPALLASLAQARVDELVVLQLLSERTSAPWQASIERAVTSRDGNSFFADWPALPKLAAEKCSAPLRAVVLRLAVSAGSPERVVVLADAVSRALDAVTPPPGNALVSFLPEERELAEADLLDRASHRSGMLASFAEFAPLVALPVGVDVLGLRGSRERSARPPDSVLLPDGKGVHLGRSFHDGEEYDIELQGWNRLGHVHIVGATGTGKSTLMRYMMLQDMAEGIGFALVDPHGALVDDVAGTLPAWRHHHTVLIDPADPELSIGWNMLSAETEIDAEATTADLVATFRRLSTSWGDQMTAVLSNAVLAIIRSGGGTLLDLRDFLIDASKRREVLGRLGDDRSASFFKHEFSLLASGKSLGPILTRLDSLLRFSAVRRIVSPGSRTLDVPKLMEEGGIILARFSADTLGMENASLLGALLVSKIHQGALRRGARTPYLLYLDEFHELATPSMAAIVTGARKFSLGLVMAHQNLYQLREAVPGVERAVLANAGTRIVFRVGEEDGRKLADGFAHFETEDLLGLSTGQAIARVGGAADDFRLHTPNLDTSKAPPELLASLCASILERYPPELEKVPAPRPVEVEAEPEEKVSRVEARRPVVEKKKPTKPATPPTPGRGGAEHQYLQALVKRLGEERGFRAVVEESVPGGQVDVALIRDDRKIAVEISVTTTPEHEVANARKCLDAGFDEVLVVSGNRKARSKIAALLDEALDDEERSKVEVFSAEEASEHLLAILPPAEETVLGYKVRRRYATLSGTEEENARKTVARIVGESLRRLEGEG